MANSQKLLLLFLKVTMKLSLVMKEETTDQWRLGWVSSKAEGRSFLPISRQWCRDRSWETKLSWNCLQVSPSGKSFLYLISILQVLSLFLRQSVNSYYWSLSCTYKLLVRCSSTFCCSRLENPFPHWVIVPALSRVWSSLLFHSLLHIAPTLLNCCIKVGVNQSSLSTSQMFPWSPLLLPSHSLWSSAFTSSLPCLPASHK